MSELPSLDDILNANDSDDDVDVMCVDLEQLLDDNDSDDEPTSLTTPTKVPINDPVDLILAEDGKEKNEIDQLLQVLDNKSAYSSPLPSQPKDQFLLDATVAHRNEPEWEESNDYGANKIVTLLSTLELADRREQRQMCTNEKHATSALQAKMTSKQEGDWDQLSHLKCLCLETISSQLSRNAQFKQHGPGTATVLHVTNKFIAVGTTRGLVLLFDHSQEMRQVIGSSTPASGRNTKSVTAVDITAAADLIVCGHDNGEIIIWEIAKSSIIKRISDLHTCRIVKICVVYGVGEVASNCTGVSGDYSIISVDSKGVVNKTKLSRVLFLSVTSEVECLLDGSAGCVLDMRALQPYVCYPELLKNRAGSLQSGFEQLPSPLPGSEQIIALNARTRSYVIRVYPEVTILNRWAAPAEVVDPNTQVVRPGFVVTLDWSWGAASDFPQLKARSGSARPGRSAPGMFPLLARGWGKTVEIYACCVPPISVSEQKAEIINSEAPHDFFTLGEVILDDVVVSVRWLGVNNVIVLTKSDICLLRLPDFVLEKSRLSEPISALVDSCLQNKGLDDILGLSVSVFKQRMYMLSPEKMFMFYLQSWREQVDQLITDGQWLDALSLALNRYEVSGKKSHSGDGGHTGDDVTAADMEVYIRRYVELAVIRQQGVTSQQGAGRRSSGGVVASHHFLVAAVCIEFCIIAGGELINVLFEEIYHIFSASHLQPIFIESLEPFILQRKIKDLPTKIFSDLLDYGVKASKFSFLERCIAHFDLCDIDINATVHLLQKYNLYSSFLYVYAFGLMDFGGAFQWTFERMMAMKTKSKSGVGQESTGFPSPEQVDVGYKLLLFLQYTSEGRMFPRGDSVVVPSSCLAALLDSVLSPIALAPFPSMPGDAPTEAQSSIWRKRYPYLYGISKIDYYALFYCLSLSTRALYSHGAAAAIKKNHSQTNESGFASLGDIFSSILDFAKYCDEEMSAHNGYQVCFYEHSLEQLVSIHVPLPDALINDIVNHCRIHIRPPDVAESKMCALVASQGKLTQSPASMAASLERNGFYFPALKLYGLKLRLTSTTLKNALGCYLSDRNDETRSKVFTYIHDFFSGMTAAADGAPTDTSAETRNLECRAVLVSFIENLASIDLKKTKDVMILYLSPTHISAIIEKTQKHQKLQFELLDAVINGSTGTPKGGDGSDLSVKDTSHEANSTAADVAENMLLSDDVLTTEQVFVYISQLSTFRPHDVFQFLSTHNNFPLDETLQICRNKEIFDATVYLLEKAGDSVAALDMCLSHISLSLAKTHSEVEKMVRAQCNEYGSGFTGGSMKRLGGGKGISSAPIGASSDTVQFLNQSESAYSSYNSFTKAVKLATGICSRLDNKSVTTHWFSVLDHLLKEKHNLMGNSSARYSIEGLSTSGVEELSRDIMASVVGSALKEFMGQMSSHVPSQDIVRRITQEQIIGSRFAEFKDVMISMVESYSHEILIFQTYMRINTNDILQLRSRRMKKKHQGYRHNGSNIGLHDSSSGVYIISGDSPESDQIDGRLSSKNKLPQSRKSGGLLSKLKTTGRLVDPNSAESSSGNVSTGIHRSVVSTKVPPMSPLSENTSSSSRRIPGSLPATPKFNAVYGY